MKSDLSNPAAGREGYADVLRPGTTLLRGQYTIVGFLSSGGFGITYLAKDSLDRMVVIKECFPSSMCFRRSNTVQVRSRSNQGDFASIVKMFGTEARRLAKLDHPNIVGVHQVFEDNETAYMALDLIRGHDLLSTVEGETEPLEPPQIKSILLSLLDAVAYIHARDILHRDISPDNVLIDSTGSPILIDFGAAREEAIRTSRVLSSMHTVKDGYSPYEFYVAGSPQGPSSDLYALGATIYHLITGNAPPDSQARVAAVAEGRADPYVPLSDFDQRFDRFFVSAINQALEIFPKNRLQSAKDWIEQIHEEKRRAAALDRAKHDKTVEDSIFRLVAETNQAVLADKATEEAPPPPPPAAAQPSPGPKTRPKAKTAAKRAAARRKPPAPAPASASKPARASRRKIQFGLPLTAALWRFARRRISFSK
ncbi:serine/threonine protein kinase [Frigidibacter sp. ROC022]|uniref:serine/threonine protein kinase n=1 Tax=Frigidibacter sp. ROC022 TaxID=2971796 RepID=UPI00215A2026|nr:serine/threonine-protein kinase [Frigidibacter sp. ROC022]MCR8725027.1 serine/threonine protein kinase [Frigidibacter sp. ROC022]